MANRSPPLVTIRAGNNRQRQRNLHSHRGALAGWRLHVDRAADFLDIGLDHIHAHAAAGNIGNLLGGGESRQKNQIDAPPARSCARPVLA